MRIAGSIGAVFFALAGCGSHSNGPAYVELPGSVALQNPDFEAPSGTDDVIPGWETSQHAGPISYKLGVDQSVSATGVASFRIERIREQVYGQISQEAPIAAHAGRTIELTAQMKTADVGPAGWQLMLTFTGGVPNPRRLAKPLAGTQDFQKVAIRTQVPQGAQKVEIAAILKDHGTAWLDDVHLRVVD
ncbi:hypothetical protein [Rudaea cellulosilytica]|jgi:hypothetical protein|uniref:hypothetical protein n=1 Tax=Rudaea cellulosilytica TaxID=540746 RepID=UPI00035CA68E|nr:hypothetical protein [Rudaea cellulosilytica]